MKNLQKDNNTSQVLDPFALASLTFDEEQGRYVAVPEERPDLLTMKYPAMADRIKAVRADDFSDKEIERMISNNIELAEAEGYTPEEIDRYYGITPESKSAVWEAEREKEIQSYAAVYSEPRKKVIEDMREAEALGISYVHLRRRRELEASPETEPPFVLHVHERAHERVQPDDPVGDSMLIRTIGGLTVGFSGALSGTFRGINWLTGFNWADELADNMDETMRTFQKEYLNGDEAGFYDSVMQGIGSTGYFLLPGTLAAKGAEKIGRVSPFLGRIFGASTSAAVESMGEAGSVYKEVLTRTGDEVSARGAASMTFWLNMPTNFISDKLAFFGEDEVIKGLLRRTGLFARASDRIVNAAGYLLRGLGGGAAEGIQETMQGAISEHYGKGTPWGQLDLLDILYEEGMPAMVSGALFGMAGSPKFADAIRQDVKGEQEVREKESARTVYDRIVEQATAAGRGDDEAKAAAAIWSARALVRSRQEGITAEEWFEKTLTGIEGGTFNAENGEGFEQPVNPGVNLEQKVPIVDISSKLEDAQKETPQSILNFLREEFIGQDPDISADAQAMIGVPSGNKARHVVRSSQRGLSYEDITQRTAGLLSLREILQNAHLIESHDNQKAGKELVGRVHRFYVPVWAGGEQPRVIRISAQEKVDSDGRIPLTLDLYDVIMEDKNEPPRLSVASPEGAPAERQLRKPDKIRPC